MNIRDMTIVFLFVIPFVFTSSFAQAAHGVSITLEHTVTNSHDGSAVGCKKLQKKLYESDKPLYNNILKVVTKIFDEVVYAKQSHGGPLERILIGQAIVSELVHIHETRGYCSPEKRSALAELYQKACNELQRLNQLPKEKNSVCLFDRLQTIKDYIQRVFPNASLHISSNYIDNLFQRIITRDIDTIGGNLAVFIGVGASVGRSKTTYGSRKVAFSGQWVFSHIGSGMFGIYHAEKYNSGHFFSKRHGWESFWKPYRWGILFTFNTDPHSYDGAKEIGLGFNFIREIRSGGFDLFKLPPDLRYFRESIGVIPSSGVMPTTNVASLT